MGGFFGTVSKAECVTDLFYGTDYNSHLGTKRAGMATYAEGEGFMRLNVACPRSVLEKALKHLKKACDNR